MKKQIVLATTFALVLSSLYCPESQAAAKPKLSKTKLTLTVGKTAKLKVKNYKGTVKWSSNKKKVAAVSKKGVVTAKKKGTAVITAKAGKKKLKCKVTVKVAANKKTQTPGAGNDSVCCSCSYTKSDSHSKPDNYSKSDENGCIYIIREAIANTCCTGDCFAYKDSNKKRSCTGTGFDRNDRKAQCKWSNCVNRLE